MFDHDQLLDEMPDEDDPAAVRAWVPSASGTRLRSSALATLALYVGIVGDGDGALHEPHVPATRPPGPSCCGGR